MKVLYDKSVMHSPLAVLRKAGYSPFMDPQSGEHSFVLRLTSEFYPRFHLYVDEKGGEVTFNLHLDQKKPSYGANHMHGGEYEGSTIEKEMRRIDGWVKFVDPDEEVVKTVKAVNTVIPESEITDLTEAQPINRLTVKKPWWKIW